MSRKPRVQRTPEEKWQIVLEGLKSGNVAETCRIMRSLRISIIAGRMKWKREPRLRLGEKRSRAARCRAGEAIKQLERALGRSHLQIEILKNVLGE